MGGQIPRQPDVAAHREIEHWLAQVQELRQAAQTLLARHPNEDLETAIKALAIAQGSLHEAAERYAE